MFGEKARRGLTVKKHSEEKIKETIRTRGDYSDVKHRTIFHDLMDSKTLPEEDKSVRRFVQEAQLLLVAGTVTTATALASAIVYLLLDEKRLVVLMQELESAMPDITKPCKEAELESLPYLVCPVSFLGVSGALLKTDKLQSAVIEETLRLVSGVSYRLTRSALTETLQLGDWTIPPNVGLILNKTFYHLTVGIDSSIHAWAPNPPLAKNLPRTMVLHPRALAHLPTSFLFHHPQSSSATRRNSTSEPQVPDLFLQRHEKLYWSAIGACGTVYDVSECAENVCEVGERCHWESGGDEGNEVV